MPTGSANYAAVMTESENVGYSLPQAGAEEFERQRLALLAEITDPFTAAQFDMIGVLPGWRCVDVGAGNGSVTRMLADRVGPTGSVLAVDIDTRLLETLTDDRIEVRTHNLLTDSLADAPFDLVHTRHLLMHLPSRGDALRRIASMVRPGGWVAIGDVHFLSLAVTPSTPAWARTWSAFCDALVAAGWDIRYGARLAADMRAIGLAGVESHEYTCEASGNHPWARLFAMTLERLRGAMLAVGGTDADIDEAIAILSDPLTVFHGQTGCYAVGRVD
jgi:2-polyprenyl-3-methyl-5-hydroxy-6-metoxy-1,4-benzoquinol methylase